uniref:Adenylosuccinate synthetase isozyme 1 n=1 Tax=Lygus hesperus TaxID=30085 RepID=A0A0A9X124_LYGHE
MCVALPYVRNPTPLHLHASSTQKHFPHIQGRDTVSTAWDLIKLAALDTSITLPSTIESQMLGKLNPYFHVNTQDIAAQVEVLYHTKGPSGIRENFSQENS